MLGGVHGAAISPRRLPDVAWLNIMALAAVAITPSPVTITGRGGADTCTALPCSVNLTAALSAATGVPVRVPCRPGAWRTATAESVALAAGSGEVVQVELVRPASGSGDGRYVACWAGSTVPTSPIAKTARTAIATLSVRRPTASPRVRMLTARHR